MDLENSGLNTNILGLKVADRVSAMLAYWDKDLVCRFANSAYFEWFGKKSEEMVDKMTVQELLGPVYDQNLPHIHGVLEGKTQTFEREYQVPNGELRNTLAHYIPDIVDGVVKGFFVHAVDVTPVKSLERQLKLSDQVIIDQNNLLLSFANIVSHNLNSYAHNFEGLLNLYVNADSEDEKTKTLGYVKDIVKDFKSTIANVNKLVEVQNLGELASQRVFLRDYTKKTIDILRIEIESINAEVINNIEDTLSILANPAYVESILLNFLTNAIKYRHPERPLKVQMDAFADNAGMVLKIQDNGSGIDLKKHGKDLFMMHKTFHGNENANGMGLYITKYQVEAIGGRIEVESQPDIGTAFIVYLDKKYIISL